MVWVMGHRMGCSGVVDTGQGAAAVLFEILHQHNLKLLWSYVIQFHVQDSYYCFRHHKKTLHVKI